MLQHANWQNMSFAQGWGIWLIFSLALIQCTPLSRHIDRSLQGPEALTEPRCSQSVWGTGETGAMGSWSLWSAALPSTRPRLDLHFLQAESRRCPYRADSRATATDWYVQGYASTCSRSHVIHVHQPVLIRVPQTNAWVHRVRMTCWYKVTTHACILIPLKEFPPLLLIQFYILVSEKKKIKFCSLYQEKASKPVSDGLCSCGKAWSVLVLEAAVAAVPAGWQRGALVSGPPRPGCPSRQTEGAETWYGSQAPV